jgi:hypothetical protein
MPEVCWVGRLLLAVVRALPVLELALLWHFVEKAVLAHRHVEIARAQRRELPDRDLQARDPSHWQVSDSEGPLAGLKPR